MVGCELVGKQKDKDWLDTLLSSTFFGSCKKHEGRSKNEENVFCIDCMVSLCRHCLKTHCLHKMLQICKYMYQDVTRLQDIQKYFDCSKIQTYKINGEKAIHLNPRPQPKDSKPSTKAKFGGSCEACRRYLQDLPNRFCSIACKVSIAPVKPKNLKENSNIPCTVQEFPKLSLKGNSNPEDGRCSENEESSFSDSDASDDTTPGRSGSLSKPRTRLRKRKFPQRAPLF